jgi:hypothetical protein
MMHSVTDDHVPQDIADCNRAAKEFNFAIEIIGCELPNPGNSLLVDALVCRGQRFD